MGTSTNTENELWRPSAANRPSPDYRFRARRKRRRLSSIIFLLLLILFVTYEFHSMWREPQLRPALALAMGALIVFGILLLTGLLLCRPSKREDGKSILRL